MGQQVAFRKRNQGAESRSVLVSSPVELVVSAIEYRTGEERTRSAMADGKVDTDLGNSALRGGETSALASAVAGGARFPSRLVGMEEAPAYMHRPGISHGYRIGTAHSQQ